MTDISINDDAVSSGLSKNNDAGWLDNWLDTVLPSRAILVALLVPLTIMKLVQVFYASPVADEAYYWLWGQHPALSYYDHPPLLAWIQSVSAALFGWSIYAVRLLTLITTGLGAWIIWFWSKRIAPSRSVNVFLAAIIFTALTPLMMRYQSLAIQDCLLIVFAMGTAHFLALFMATMRDDATHWTFYYAACICIGLAALTKYSGIFLAVGVALAVFIVPLARQLLLRLHFWLGAALVLAMQTPVIVWNMQHDWPSFRYNLQDRIGQSIGGGPTDNLIFLAINSAVFLGPVFFIALVRFVGPDRDGYLRDFRLVGRWIVIASSLTFLALSYTNTVLPYWNMVAWAVPLPALIFFIRSRLEFYIHIIFCMTVGAWLIVSYTLYPLHKRAGEDIRDIDISFGLSTIAAEVAQDEKALGVDFVMTTDYRTASMLALTRGKDDVVKIGKRNDQFDFWIDQQALKGKDALVLTDDYLPVSELVEDVFETVTLLRSFTVRAYGFDIHTYHLYYAENYSGEGDT